MIDRNPLGVQSVKSDIHQFSPDGDKGTVVYMCYCNLQNSTLLDEGNFAIGLLLRNSLTPSEACCYERQYSNNYSKNESPNHNVDNICLCFLRDHGYIYPFCLEIVNGGCCVLAIRNIYAPVVCRFPCGCVSKSPPVGTICTGRIGLLEDPISSCLFIPGNVESIPRGIVHQHMAPGGKHNLSCTVGWCFSADLGGCCVHASHYTDHDCEKQNPPKDGMSRNRGFTGWCFPAFHVDHLTK